MKIIHLTDTHLMPPGRTLYGLDPRARLRACLADIAAHHRQADLCVITGDLAHAGQGEAYAVLRECLEGFPLPVRLLLGNHDDRPAFVDAFPEAPRDPAGFVQSSLDSALGRFLFLDTLLAGSHGGAYCRARRDWLARMLEEIPDSPVLLFMHHAPVLFGLPGMDALKLRDLEAFRATLAPHKARIRHIFFGHVHRAVFGTWQGLPFSSLRATNHQCRFEGNLRDNRVGSHEAPSYAVVSIDAEQITVQDHDFNYDGPTFDLGDTRWRDWDGKGRPPGGA